MAEQLELFTLGGLRIQRQDAAVGVSLTRKMRALLVYLALDRREHQREQLAALLWGDMNTHRALANLRTALSTLQQELADYFFINRQTVSINPRSALWIDVAHIQMLTARAQPYWNTQRILPPAEAEPLEQALALYQGEFLDGFAFKDSDLFEEWRLAQGNAVRLQITDALGHLVQDAMTLRSPDIGLKRVRWLLQLDPLGEAAHRQMMMLLAMFGQRSAALAHYESCREQFRQQLGVDPSPDMAALANEISRGQLPSHSTAQSAVSGLMSLPALPTPFVNRAEELAQIGARLRQPTCRLLTLVGIGGAGKTRLAIEAVTQVSGEFADGAIFVALEGVKDAEFLPSALGAALKITFQPSATLRSQLIAELAPRNLLLVLDNFEHLQGGAELVSALLSGCSRLKILVTSRERLNLQEEWIISLSGMPVPLRGDGVDLEQYNAVQLFVQNAKRVSADFSLQDNADDVIRICQLVEGLPLGIELAASWTRLLSCRRIVEETEKNLGFLSTTVKNVSERHRNIHALLEQSWQHLGAAEQIGLRRLSIFRGTFDLPAAIQITQMSLPTLGSLIDLAMVRVAEADRYSVHELLRRFGMEKLQAAAELEPTIFRYCDYFIRWLETCAGLQASEPQALSACDGQYSNIRAALGWATEQKDALRLLRLCNLLKPYWEMRGYATEGRGWVAEGFKVSAAELIPLSLRAAAWACTGVLEWMQGDYQQARQSLSESLDLAHTLDDKATLIESLIYLALIALFKAQYADAQRLIEEAVAVSKLQPDRLLEGRSKINLALIFTEMCEYEPARVLMEEALQNFEMLNAREHIATTVNVLGIIALAQGHYELARYYFERHLTIAYETGNKIGIAVALANLAEVVQHSGDLAAALASYMESLRLLREIGAKPHISRLLGNFASVALAQGDYRRAVRLWSAATAQRNAISAPWSMRDLADCEADLCRLREVLDPASFDEAWDAGQSMIVADEDLIVDPAEQSYPRLKPQG